MAATTLEPLPKEQTQVAGEAARQLIGLIDPEQPEVHLRTESGESITVPEGAFRLFVDMLGHLANGDGVALLPEHAELSTQQAADLLNVSRPYVVQLVESHRLPARRVGSHRRIRLSDLMNYKRADDADREAVMQELADQAQELDLGY
jgi:excisionase family DNA binding protein